MTTSTEIAGEAMTDAVNDGQSERAAFEADYAMVWNAAMKENGWGGGHTADDVKALREGDTYGEGRDYLNARWEGWQARAALTAEKVAGPKLAVWYGAMPESNGKTNWTAILHKGDRAEGHTIARSEYPDRVRYEADCVRSLIGELQERPWILDYDADKHSGYTAPTAALENGDKA